MTSFVIRQASMDELEQIIAIMKADPVIGEYEIAQSPPLANYRNALEQIIKNDWQCLAVALDQKEVIGTLQLSFIPHLYYRGASQCLIEAVLVKQSCQGRGIGKELMAWAIEQAKQHNCRVIQLSSNKKRPQAHHFYEKLGFVATHEGFKIMLPEA